MRVTALLLALLLPCIGPASSAVERHLYTVSVGGSIPPLGTNFKVSLEECVSG